MSRPLSCRFGNLRTAAAVAALMGCGSSALRADEGLEFYEKKIRPLLVERCYECHSEGKKVKAGLRLDVPDGWLTGGDSGPALIPGNVDGSRIIRAVRYVDIELEAMPPKSALPPEEIALLEEWVRRGAPAPATPAALPLAKRSGLSLEEGRTFWAFVPPADVPVPTPRGPDAWARTDIDRFIAAGWEKLGLQPQPDADRASLIRRLIFDLIGLPPEPGHIDAFVRDTRPDAFERVVDSLLASPHFGERLGRRWLDVARFAESSGGGRTLLFKEAWRYRDYVIDSLNRDVPFDTFIREQIAGDLLPYSTAEQRSRQLTATAFLALGPNNYEEQNKGALRMDIVDEQLDTIGKGFLGMTIGCARCHDHKFDPIPTHDYYALAGILRSTRTLENYTDNVARWVETPLPLDEHAEAEFKVHQQKVAGLQVQLKALRLSAGKSTSAVASFEAPAREPVQPEALPGIVLDEPTARIVGEWQKSGFGRIHVGDGFLHDRNEGKGTKTITFSPTLPRTGRYDVRLAYTPNPNRAPNVPVAILHAEGERTVTIDQRETPPIGGRFISLGQFQFEKDGQGYVLVSNEGTTGVVVVDALQLFPVDTPANSAKGAAAASGSEGNTDGDGIAARIRRLEGDLKRLTAQGPRRPATMSVTEAEDVGDTEIRIRGNVRTLGAKVSRGFLQVAMRETAPRIPAGESGRMQLADWIASPDNPLTARVAVNRTWAWLMGAGIVRTVDNFGATGETPTHPELLDYLARRFIAEGWSMKQLVRSIVLSRTYQLATASPDERDPDNRWLARAQRRRLDAEQIRDAILWTSGELKLDVGGPNIGSGPSGAENLPVNAEYGYVYSDTRRSVYTPAFRNKRLELFEVFDFADINAPMGQRNVSTVAPQALFLMNHPFVIEQAKRAAARALALTDRSDDVRVMEAYRTTLGRAPTARERELALQYLAGGSGVASSATAAVECWAHLYQALFACVDFRYLN